MSRCYEWHKAHDGIINYLLKNNLATEKTAIKKAKEHIYKFTKDGSFSERCLQIGKDFETFKKYLKIT